MTTCARRFGATSSILPPVTAKAPTMRAGQPFVWTVWKYWSNYYIYFENVWTKFHHLRSTTLKDCDSAKEAINQAHAFALEQGTFDQKVFYEAFGIFDNQSIEKSLVSQNPLVRIFALLDRRLGKRRLLALEESMEQELDWVRAFYVIRMQAEGLMEKE